MYVPGTLRSNDSVIVEIGTGYYVRKVCGIHDTMDLVMIGC